MAGEISSADIHARAVSSGIAVETAARLMLGSVREADPAPDPNAVAARADQAGITQATAELLLRHEMRGAPDRSN